MEGFYICRSLLLSHSNPKVLYIEEEEHITGTDPAFFTSWSLYMDTRDSLPPSNKAMDEVD